MKEKKYFFNYENYYFLLQNVKIFYSNLNNGIKKYSSGFVYIFLSNPVFIHNEINELISPLWNLDIEKCTLPYTSKT